jgi:alpha-ribazole phosphatase
MSETRWWWLRHAPVPESKVTIIGGMDPDADTSEHAMFKALADCLPANPVLVESGLRRCRQTADALRDAGLKLRPPIIEPGLVEQDFGHWQGHSWAELSDAKDPDLPPFWAAPAETVPPGGESFAQVLARVKPAVARLSDQHLGRDILAIAHAGSIRAALCIALDLPADQALRFSLAPLSLTRLELTGGGWRVECVNHLAG